METAHLFHLAHIAAPAKGRIFSAAAHMIFAGRTSAGHEFIDPAQVARLEPIVGRACLDAVIAFEIPDEVRLVTGGWEQEGLLMNVLLSFVLLGSAEAPPRGGECLGGEELEHKEKRGRQNYGAHVCSMEDRRGGRVFIWRGQVSIHKNKKKVSRRHIPR